jgi:flavin-dependent dehydrogenase
MHTDVLIVGDGIAGLTLSFLLEKKEIDHVLLHRNGIQMENALGETLPPSAIPFLHRHELLELFEQHAVQKMYGYHAWWGGNQVNDHNFFTQSPSAYGIKLDKQGLLTDLARSQQKYRVVYDKNFEMQFGHTCGMVVFDQASLSQTLNFKLLVDATGRKRAVLNKLGVTIDEYDHLTAFSCHLSRFNHPRLTHTVYTETFPDGWGIVSALNKDVQVMTLYTDRAVAKQRGFSNYTNWPEILEQTNYLRHFLTGDEQTKVRGYLANTSKPNRVAGENWLAVGDAAIAFDPLSSHGITNAVYTAIRAAIAIEKKVKGADSDQFKIYAADLEVIFKQYMQIKNHLYRQEQRWTGSDFWAARQSEPIMSNLIL